MCFCGFHAHDQLFFTCVIVGLIVHYMRSLVLEMWNEQEKSIGKFVKRTKDFRFNVLEEFVFVVVGTGHVLSSVWT